MENNNINNNEKSVESGPITQTNNPKTEASSVQPRLSTPTAIVLAGLLIMIGIVVSRGGSPNNTNTTKTLSEQVGVSKDSLAACVKSTDMTALKTSIDNSVDKAMSPYAQNERGTPYAIVIGVNGVMTDIRGADSYENVKKVVDDALVGKVTNAYKGNVSLVEPNDYSKGPASATVTIIEYSDFECPYCKIFHPVLEKIVTENAPNVRWIYRHYPLHQNSFAMLTAANCIGSLKGDDAFFKYSDLLFGLLETPEDRVSGKL